MVYLNSTYQSLLALASYLTPQMSLFPIGILAAFWLVLCILTVWSFAKAETRINSQLQKFNPLYLEETLPSGNDLLGQLVREYRKALVGRSGIPDTQALVAMKIAPVGALPERLARWASATPVGLGLLGTFLGLVNAINAISTNLRSLGSDIDPNNLVATVTATLNEPLSGMGVAFISSIAGLIVSFIMSFIMAGLDFPGRRAQLADQIEHFLNNRLFPAIHVDPFQKVMNQLGDRIGHDFDRSLTLLGERMTEMSGHMIETMEGLNSLVSQLATAGEALDKGSTRLLEFNDRLEKSLSQIDHSSERVVSSTNHLADGVSRLQSVLGKIEEHEGTRIDKLEEIWDSQQRVLGEVTSRLVQLLGSFPERLSATLDEALSENRATLEKLLSQEQQEVAKLASLTGATFDRLETRINQTFTPLQKTVEDLQASQRSIQNFLKETQESATNLAQTVAVFQDETEKFLQEWAGGSLRVLNRGLDNFARKVDLIQQLTSPYEEKLDELREAMADLKAAYAQNVPLALAVHFDDLRKLQQTMGEAEKGFKHYGEQVAATVATFAAGVKELSAGIEQLAAASEALASLPRPPLARLDSAPPPALEGPEAPDQEVG